GGEVHADALTGRTQQDRVHDRDVGRVAGLVGRGTPGVGRDGGQRTVAGAVQYHVERVEQRLVAVVAGVAAVRADHQLVLVGRHRVAGLDVQLFLDVERVAAGGTGTEQQFGVVG